MGALSLWTSSWAASAAACVRGNPPSILAALFERTGSSHLDQDLLQPTIGNNYHYEYRLTVLLFQSGADHASSSIFFGNCYRFRKSIYEELRRLRNKEPFTEEMIGKIHDRIFHFAAGFFATQGIPLPPWEELMHTYIFRFSICATMHALRWIAVGGVKKVGKDRIRNDIIDASIAAQALCFDGFLSKDVMAQEIYSNSLFILNQFLAFDPSKHAAIPQRPRQPRSGSRSCTHAERIACKTSTVIWNLVDRSGESIAGQINGGLRRRGLFALSMRGRFCSSNGPSPEAKGDSLPRHCRSISAVLTRACDAAAAKMARQLLHLGAIKELAFWLTIHL
jgi:hypothetical protein